MTVPAPWTVVWIAAVLLSSVTIVRAILRGHGVESTLAWVFAMIAFPGVGALAYLVLASPSIRRTRKRKRRAASSVRESIAGTFGRQRPAPRTAGRTDPRGTGANAPASGSAEDRLSGVSAKVEATAADHASAAARAMGEADAASLRQGAEHILQLSASLTGLLPTGGNAVRQFEKNDRAFEDLEGALRAAQRSIWAEYYMIRNDATGQKFLNLLASRAADGVEVRLLYDGVGSLGLDRRRLRALVASGGAVETFLPMNPARRRWSVHLRNHRKIVIIDGTTGYTGGMNVGDEYSGRSWRRGGERFRDSLISLRGPAVADLAQTFAEDWSFATGRRLKPEVAPVMAAAGSSIVAVVPSGPDQEHNAIGMVYFAGVAAARERVWLTSPYFIPDQPMIHALESAALRGADVRVLVPARGDVLLVGPAGRSYYRSLTSAGVRIWEYQPSMLHAKTMVVDGIWGMVGSANLDMRSFRLNFELGAVVVDRRFAERLEQRFEKDLAESVEVTAEMIAAWPVTRRLANGTARLLSPLL